MAELDFSRKLWFLPNLRKSAKNGLKYGFACVNQNFAQWCVTFLVWNQVGSCSPQFCENCMFWKILILVLRPIILPANKIAGFLEL